MGFPVVPDDECSSTTSSSGTANRPYGKVSRSTDLSVNGSMRTSSSVLMSEGVTPESSMRARYQGTRSYVQRTCATSFSSWMARMRSREAHSAAGLWMGRLEKSPAATAAKAAPFTVMSVTRITGFPARRGGRGRPAR